MIRRVVCIVGTRPEVIKMSPVIAELRRRAWAFEVFVWATGQHQELAQQALDEFGLEADLDLAVMARGQSPTMVAARVLSRLEPALKEVFPDWVLVQGDTTTVAAAALAAHYAGIRVGHVEAGLRTYDRASPFPEEANRVITDHLSDLLFPPTEAARRNLTSEGIGSERVFVTGNTVVDAVKAVAAALPPATVPPASAERLVFATLHRRESHGEPMRRICRALAVVAERDRGRRVVVPVHPSPAVGPVVREELENVPGISLVPPLSYSDCVQMLRAAEVIVTDSGGIQEEAPSFGVPVLVVRDRTERPEAVEAGVAKVIGTYTDRIVEEVEAALTAGRGTAPSNPFGDGRAAARIADVLETGSCVEFKT